MKEKELTIEDLPRMPAVDLARAIAAGETTSEAVVSACLDRIAAREDAVMAWAHIDPDAALVAAKEADRTKPLGPLHGIPFGVKDIFDTSDQPTEYGSPIFAGHQPRADAANVALARRAGMIVLGKTETTEFATFQPTRTRNPVALDHTPGGSSSGSVAAVADGMVPLATGTQTAGSTIRPASYTGIVGYKPSFGLIPRAGMKPTSETLDTVGVFARSLGDVAAFAEVLGGRELPGAQEEKPGPPKIGLCRTYQWDEADPSMQSAVEEAAVDLAAAGADMSEVPLPNDFEALAEAHWTILAFEAGRCLADERRRHGEMLSDGLRALVDEGLSLPADRYVWARLVADSCRQRIEETFAELDVLITPPAPGEAPAGLATTGDSILNRTWTLLGNPCITIPVFTGPAGLPMGLQIVGGFQQDRTVCRHASWIWEALSR